MVLLCFALLLPAAQVASAVHALAHLASVQQDGRSQDAADLPTCEICPLAAAVGLGGAPAAVPVVHGGDAPGCFLAPAAVARMVAAALRLFDSRGPPALLH